MLLGFLLIGKFPPCGPVGPPPTWEHGVAGGVEGVELQHHGVVRGAEASRAAFALLLHAYQRLLSLEVVDGVPVGSGGRALGFRV